MTTESPHIPAAPAEDSSLAIAFGGLRPIDEGAIQVTVSADDCEEITITIDAHAVT